MRVVVQKVINANVSINNKEINSIDKGLLLLVGFTQNDTIDTLKWMANKVLNLRVFEDDNDIMNLSIKDIKGSILSISQFTLYGDATKGNRPSYINALSGNLAEPLYHEFNNLLNKDITTKEGIFGADMKISLINDGPTTILLEK